MAQPRHQRVEAQLASALAAGGPGIVGAPASTRRLRLRVAAAAIARRRAMETTQLSAVHTTCSTKCAAGETLFGSHLC